MWMDRFSYLAWRICRCIVVFGSNLGALVTCVEDGLSLTFTDLAIVRGGTDLE